MKLIGKCVVPGVAVGRIHVYKIDQFIPKESFIFPEEEQQHIDRYQLIKLQALNELDILIEKLKSEDENDPKIDIFTAHKEIVDDIIINEEIPLKIKTEKWAGDWAIFQVYETVLNTIRSAEDPFFAERAHDFEDIRSLLLRKWNSFNSELSFNFKDPIILAISELMPSYAATLNLKNVLAIVTETGGLTSHAAIIVKSLGIPTIFGIPNLMKNLKDNQEAVVDSKKGLLILDPDMDISLEYQKKALYFKMEQKENLTFLSKDCKTSCGTKIDIGLNINNVEKDLESEQYVDFAGVFRTEFLYMGKKTLPTEDEQFEIYKKVLEKFKDKPVVIRTLDIGGDKNLSYLKIPKEDNPFLGVRALRLCFKFEDLFLTQLKAILRASKYGNPYIMFPMAGSIEDINRAKNYIVTASEEIDISLLNLRIGIMIEIPSIALIADLVSYEVDFASVGSNDLCQYLCASDRMNVEVEDYYQSYHPGMLRLIKEVISSFNIAGKPISICGELASDIWAVPLLLGLGFRKLSMSASSVASVKRIISGFSIKDCEELADKALKCSTQEEIEKLLKINHEKFRKKHFG